MPEGQAKSHAPESAPTPPVSTTEVGEGDGPLLLEVAWEVCNQVGGIYQVLRSKAPSMVARWGDRYCLVGPYNEEAATLEFEPTRPTGLLGRAVNVLRDAGLIIHHGRWLVLGRPRVLLIENKIEAAELDRVRHRFWQEHQLSLLDAGALVDEVLVFADAVHKLLAAIAQHGTNHEGDESGASRPIVAHFHEWMGGMAIPMVRHSRLPVSTVFTTHATLLGRYLASNDAEFYDHLPHLNHEEEAQRYNVQSIHKIERACAHGAHIFTTVSSITGEECARLLGRRPDVLLPNGLNRSRDMAPHQLQHNHELCKARIDRFVMGHFFPSYPLDLENTLYFFTSGRFEPRNKGFDLSLEAMARLNAHLKASDLDVNVVFFVITNRPTHSILQQALHRRAVLDGLEDSCQSIASQLSAELFRRSAAGEDPPLAELIDERAKLRLRRARQGFRSSEWPSVITHQLSDDASDPVLNHIRSLWMFNRPDDPAKIVYHPKFISPDNPLWGIDYDQFVRGCHLGVFPSAYEPWGYTPLECASVGVASISSDLAGFGRYVQENLIGHHEMGVQVLPRRGRHFHDAAADLAWRLFEFCRLDQRERIALRTMTERQSGAFDWRELAGRYHEAHDAALLSLGATAPDA